MGFIWAQQRSRNQPPHPPGLLNTARTDGILVLLFSVYNPASIPVLQTSPGPHSSSAQSSHPGLLQGVSAPQSWAAVLSFGPTAAKTGSGELGFIPPISPYIMGADFAPGLPQAWHEAEKTIPALLEPTSRHGAI